MGYKAVIFDMDGLMIDSERLCMRAWTETCASMGLEMTEAIYANTIGKNASSVRSFYLTHFGENFPLEEAVEVSDELYRKYLDTTKGLAKPGLVELLNYIESTEMKLAVCSSSSRAKIDYKLNRIGVRDRIRVIVGGDEVSKGKPDPEPYRAVAGKLGLATSECLVLEDSYTGVHSAHAAGSDVAMIPDLLEPTDEMHAKCIRIFDTLHDAIGFLQLET